MSHFRDQDEDANCTCHSSLLLFNKLLHILLIFILLPIIPPGCEKKQDRINGSVERSSHFTTVTDHELEMLKKILHKGTPREKEEILNLFGNQDILALVPDVIMVILDDTPSPRHGDTGWGTVYHQAATVLCEFAFKWDGISLKERGRREYSFYDEGGVATAARRREVFENWRAWWEKNQKYSRRNFR
ncbi:MAG: hypothetical protein JXB60_07425 [Candidatus Cloacimonetes bacterium]|nr:hypothetical protein [Candidatus Cloacimonadota bacterium]